MPTLFPLISEGWVVLGLDMRFLAEKRKKKNNGNSNGNRISGFALRATLSAFGRVGVLSRLPDAGLKRQFYPKGNSRSLRDDNKKGEGKGNSHRKGKNNGKGKSNGEGKATARAKQRRGQSNGEGGEEDEAERHILIRSCTFQRFWILRPSPGLL